MEFQFWDILTSLPGVGVCIVDLSGRFVFVNAQYGELFLGRATPIEGQTVAELYGQELAREFDAIAFECLQTGKPLTVYTTVRGRALESTCWAMRPVPDAPRRIIAVSRELVREATPRNAPGFKIIQNIDLGPLSQLTRRELSILTLLGHGIPQKKIASLLKVSQRTIERHRTHISQKLGTRSIAEMAHLVQVAGLKLDPPQR